jgi:hypothetical protein
MVFHVKTGEREMHRSRLLTLMALGLCASLIGMTGCDSDDDDSGDSGTATGLPGTWSLSSATLTAPQIGDNADLLQLAGADVSGNTLNASGPFLSLFGIGVTLIVDDDGTWSMQVTVPSIPGYVSSGTYTVEGTYTTSGDRLTFTVTSAPSQSAGLVDAGDSYTISYSETGSTLELSASSADLGVADVSATLRFTR